MNIRLGIAYYKQLEKRFRGDKTLALAAYNWGPTNVDKNGRRIESAPRSVRKYSKKILDKTERWNRQFERASKRAKEFQETLARSEQVPATTKDKA